jgi:hypothetical protein
MPLSACHPPLLTRRWRISPLNFVFTPGFRQCVLRVDCEVTAMGATELKDGQPVGQCKIFAGLLGWVAVLIVFYLSQKALRNVRQYLSYRGFRR